MTLDQRGSLNLAICGNIRGSLRTAIAVTIARCGQSAGKADLGRGRNPQRLHAERHASDDDTVRSSRRREEVARNRGPPESLVNQVTRSNSSERNTLSLNWRLA